MTNKNSEDAVGEAIEWCSARAVNQHQLLVVQVAKECQSIKDERYRLANANIELRAENERLRETNKFLNMAMPRKDSNQCLIIEGDG